MIDLKHRRHAIVVCLWVVGQILLALAMGFAGDDWLQWLEQGPLGEWVHGSVLIITGLILGLAVVSTRREDNWRSLAVTCLAGLLAAAQWVLGNIGVAILVSHWIPAPMNVFHLLLPIFGGLLCCAPLLMAPYMPVLRRRWAASSPPAGGTTDVGMH